MTAGLTLALYVQLPFAAGGWITGALLAVFALLGRQFTLREHACGAGATA